MKKMENVLMGILVLFVFGVAGCGTIFPVSPTSPEIVTMEPSLYIIKGESQIEGFRDFSEKMKSTYGNENVAILEGYSLVEGVEEHLEDIRECDSILIISPTHRGIGEFQDLENKYPDLCPIPCDKLESKTGSCYSSLLYFSRDDNGKFRGIVIAEKVTHSLAKLLVLLLERSCSWILV